MAKRNRKRKLESEEESDSKWELTNILNEELREEMATMWEIPQIFHFLHMAKEALNISHLSMYEMERMLAMPRASKQLATIMTSLLGPPLPKNKVRKIPLMPYDFWVNVLTHKVKGWFKVYQSKHRDIVKVFETIGVEPDFWRIFPDTSVIDDKEFDQISFKQRVWILKTLCDTLMHSRKTIQDEISKQISEDSCEVVLGADRYGAKFIYFPLFLDNDLRVYRHCIDNTILSTVKPPPWKEGQACSSRPEKMSRTKRKRSRWKNGALPREKRRSKKSQEDETKMSGDSAVGSASLNDDTNFSGTSSCSNNNNLATESNQRHCSRSPSKTSELSSCPSNETRSSNPKSSGYDTNTSTSDVKSLNEIEPEEMFRGFSSEIDNDNSIDTIGNIHDILNRLTRKVSETIENDENDVDVRGDEEKEKDEDDASSNVIDAKFSDNELAESRADSSDDEDDSSGYNRRKTRHLDPEEFRKELHYFSGMLADLSHSTFELAADGIDSLRDLATNLMTPEMNESRRTPIVPKCEMMLGRAMEDLAESLKNIEPKLREATKKARTKLRRELTNCKDGVIEDEDASGDVNCGSNGWVIGSQGCPMLSSSETTLQTLPDPALSPAGSENIVEHEQHSRAEQTDENPDGDFNKDEKNSEDVKVDERGAGVKSESTASGENDDDEDSEPQTRRVLRARGISSYTEQLSSDEEEAYELEEWSRPETVDSTPVASAGTSGVNAAAKIGQTDEESEETDSDQDWILPGARRRKNKRSPNRRLKSSQQKLSITTGNFRDYASNVSPPVPEDSDQSRRVITKHSRNTDSSVICKVESIHSELDIKDEGPMYEYNRGTTLNPSSSQNSFITDNGQPVRAAGARRVGAVGPPPPPGMMLQQLPPGYYVQGAQTYYDPRYVRYPYPPPNRGGLTYAYHQPLPPHRYPSQQPYWQSPNYPPMSSYPVGAPRSAGYQGQRGISQRHQGPSTTLYGARLPSQLPQNRMPAPRLIASQNSALRFPTRPRAPLIPAPQRRCAPRPGAVAAAATPQNPAARVPRPNRPSAKPPVMKKPGEKSTSLILLSDSDDEIEMIVPEKQTTSVGQNRKTPVSEKDRQVSAASKPKTRPVVTSQITMSKSNELLSPQMIQRMSQGGISITPVKPPASKETSGDSAAQGTKLVVVVNETGSHYALALPNGSKLILTPEQVAQIRASNGGKLVL